MARPKHPVTQRIEEALELLERNAMEITPASVKVNAEKAITWADWTPEQASSEALDARIARCLRQRGYQVVDAEPREGGRVRKNFWFADADELEEQLEVKQDSSDADLTRITADKAVIDFLREKEQEMGYEVYPGLFHADIDRIYSMHGIRPPANEVAA